MRLIDADAIAFRCNYNGVCMSSRERCLQCQHYVCDGESIKNEPTAYNLDAVVEELEKFSLNTESHCNEMLRNDNCGFFSDCDYCKLQKAINIVRKGGVK